MILGRKHIGLILVQMLAWVLIPAGAEERPPVQEVVTAIDRLYRHESARTLMEMEIRTPHWTRSLRMEAWSEGMEKTFIRILEPRKERGMGTLKIGNEMWNYLPKTNRVMKIPPSMMMSSWMGSDFRNNDLVKEFTFTEDYDFEYTRPADAEEGKLYLSCIPKPGRPIVWGHVLVRVDRRTLLPEREEYYDEQGKLMRVMEFAEPKNFSGQIIPSRIELVPRNKEGHRTILRYLEAEFDVRLREDIFSLRNLRNFRP